MSGRYANASDHVRELIRKVHLELEQLRQALIEGEISGSSTELDIDTFITNKKSHLFMSQIVLSRSPRIKKGLAVTANP